MAAAGIVLAAAAVALIVRGRPGVRGTTLVAAWRWGLMACTAWLAAWVANAFATRLPSGWIDQAWHTVAVLSLAPAIAVLGARRPGSSAWTGFVVVPMIVVLHWPAWSQWRSDGPPDRLLLEAPAIVGMLVPLVMGGGNYFGTRFTAAAAIYAAAMLCVVLPSAGARLPADAARLAGTALLVAATLAGRATARRRPTAQGWDRVWRDFRNAFGIVWARRVMDRVNEAAQGEGWNARLELDGFVPATGVRDPLPANETASRLEHWMRFVLRRFVDPEWIDARVTRADVASRREINDAVGSR